jgi:transmembrane sensor
VPLAEVSIEMSGRPLSEAEDGRQSGRTTGKGMSNSEEPGNGLTPLQSEAHAWIRRLVSGQATAMDAAALRRWCEQSPAHSAAFSEASQFWAAFGPAGQSLLEDEKTATAGISLRGQSMVTRRRAIIGGALAASAAGLLVARPPLDLWPSWSELAADYRTRTGEQRQIIMPDGVAIRMNTRTSISVHRDGDAAVIELIAGEASFAPSDRQVRRFSVVAAGGKASADRAQFDVRRLDSGACVTCLNNEVEVDYQARTVVLGPHQRVTYKENGFGKIASIDPAVVAAWQNGLLIFNMTPLAEVVEELNRYRTGRIILLNQTVAASPVSGRFRIDRPDEALIQIERAFGVRGRALPGGFVLLS